MKDEEFILGLLLSYSMIIAQGVPKNSDNEIWVKPCCDMYKIFLFGWCCCCNYIFCDR